MCACTRIGTGSTATPDVNLFHVGDVGLLHVGDEHGDAMR
jgi:hypothetical protein